MNKLFRFSLLLSLLAIIMTACVDQDFDSPPSDPKLPDIMANTTIADLKARHIVGEFEEITDDVIIKGVVISDDQPGNFFRKLQIQDATGGIELAIDATELHNDYPLGREVFVKCQGLTIGDYAGLIQLGLGTVPSGTFINTGRIPELVLGNYLVKGARGEAPVGKVVTIDDLAADPYDENMGGLITLENVEFVAGAVGETYAIGGASPQSVNLDITDCDGNTITLRTSGYSNFATSTVPGGNGNLTAVYTLFNSTRQLVIRDTTDVDFQNSPCLRGTGSGDIITISELRNIFAQGGSSVPADSKIKGVVISDRNSNSINSQNVVIQDATAGITVRFTSDHNFDLGDELEINVSGADLSEFRTLLQVDNVSNGVAEVKQSGITPTSRTLTVAELKSDFENLESSLIKFEDVTLTSSGGTFAGTVVLTDATGSIDIFTFNSASFANSLVPTGTVTVTAIASQYDDTEQLVLRSASDVEGGMTGGGLSEEMNISDLRALYTGSTTAAPSDKKIKGIVISDAGNENITGRNLVIQGADGSGIVVRFSENHSYELGDELEIELIGAQLSDYNGLVQVDNTPIGNATKLGTGTITANEMTISELLSRAGELESTLIKIVGATITSSSGSAYGGTTTVADATGSIPMFTRSQATFAGSSIPSGSVNITAIVSNFDGYQINIRSLDDVE